MCGSPSVRCFLFFASSHAIYSFRALCSFQFFARTRFFPAKTAKAERTRIWVSRIQWQSQYLMLFVLGGLASSRAIYFFRALCSFKFLARTRFFPAKTANAERTQIWVSRIQWQSQYAMLFDLGGLAASRAISFFRALCSFKFLARTRFFHAKTAKAERTQIWVSRIQWQSQYAMLFDLGGLAASRAIYFFRAPCGVLMLCFRQVTGIKKGSISAAL